MLFQVTMKNELYDVIIQRNSLDHIEEYLDLNRKVLIITDNGIPSIYINKVLSKCSNGFVYVIEQGEKSKNFSNYEKILDYMIENSFLRTDCVIAVGGGVVGDLAGFVSSTYMRGITFYNIPTTLLSQVDSSIGGKTAIDKKGIKNIIGAFYPPKKVIIDSNVLETLDKRQFYSGLVEALKMGLTSDVDLYQLIKNSSDIYNDIDKVIEKALLVKKSVVERDPEEKGIRKILNFGHTVGHAIESSEKFNLLHGECVGIGMLYMLNKNLKEEVKNILEKYNLPTSCNITKDELFKYISLDKKRNSEFINIILVNEIGRYEIKNIKLDDIKSYL